MKKLFSYIAILILTLGFFAPFSSVAHADAFSDCVSNATLGIGPKGPDGNPTRIVPVTGTQATAACASLAQTPDEQTQASAAQASPYSAPTSQSSDSCGITNLTGCFWWVLAHIAILVMTLVSKLLWLAGTILDFVMQYTVVYMAAHINGGTISATGPFSSILSGTFQPLSGINVAWKVFRDLMNIFFIFMLLYEGIKMIIGVGKQNAKGLVVGIIMASVLINFSLFFTKVLIDASNIVTIGFYNSILVDSQTLQAANPSQPVGPVAPDTSTSMSGLSVPYMKALGVSSLWSAATFSDTFASNAGGNQNMLVLGIGGSILMLIVAFVFLAVAVMFTVRYMVLLLLLMTAPIGFMGIIPALSSYEKDWWEILKGQLLFGPIFMLMTWVVLTLITSPDFITINGSGDWGKLLVGSAGAASPSSIGLIFNFILVIGLTIASLTTAKKYATKGASAIGDANKWLTAAAGGVLVGSVATVGRKTIGAQANRMANDRDLQDKAAAGDKVAQAKLKTYRGLASSSFDVRRSKAGEALQKNTGVSFGKGTIFNEKAGEGGFKKEIDEKAKKEKAYIESLKPNDTQKSEQDKIAGDAKAKLESDTFKAEEKKRNDRYFEKHPEELKDVNDAKANLDASKNAAEQQKGTAQAVVDVTTNLIKTSDEQLKKLKEDWDKAVKLETQMPGSNVQAVKDAKEKFEKEKANRESLAAQLTTEKKLLDDKVKVYQDAEKAITANEEKEKTIRSQWRSEEYKELERESQITGEKLYKQRGENYINSINRSWFVGRQKKVAATGAIQKELKGKSLDEQIAELTKKKAKEEKEARKKAGIKDEDEEETPKEPKQEEPKAA